MSFITEAIAVVRRLGGKLELDESNPSKPLLGVDLRWCAKKSPEWSDLIPLSRCRSLRWIKLGGGLIEDRHLEQLASVTSLRSIEVLHSPVTDKGLGYLRGLNELRECDINCCARVTDEGVAHLALLTNLVKLRVTRAEGVTDAGLAKLTSLKRLRELDLTGCGLSDKGIASLQGFPELVRVDLSVMELHDAALEPLAALPKLRHVEIRYTWMTDKAVAKFRRLRPDVMISNR